MKVRITTPPFNHGFKQTNENATFSRVTMMEMDCSQADQTQKQLHQPVVQPLMHFVANFLGFEF